MATARIRGVPLALVREQVALIGVQDGSNRVFTLPGGEKAVHQPGAGPVVKIYFDTRRVQSVEMSVEESGGVGTGFDRIRFLHFAPKTNSSIFADYVAA